MVLEFVVIGVVCLITVVVYMLGVVGTKETSFEDAVAEQRLRQQQEQGGSRGGKKHKVSGEVGGKGWRG